MAIDFIKEPKPEDLSVRNRSYDYYIEPEKEVLAEPVIDLDAEQKKLDAEKAEFESLKAASEAKVEGTQAKEPYKPFTKKK